MERVTDTTDQEREDFLRRTIEPLGATPEIVEAFRQVDRAEFAPESEKHLAYTDKVIPIDDDSTISQPSLVVVMINLLEVKPDDTVLEIGTATGYQASVLSHLSREVHTIERKPDISAIALENIARLGYANISVHTGDGAQGIPGKHFDRIIVTAALKSLPEALEDQLQEGGVLIAPVGPTPKDCVLTKYVKSDGVLRAQEHGECAFVPLYSGESGGWDYSTVNRLQKRAYQDHRPHTKKLLHKRLEGTSQTYDEIIAKLGVTMANTLGRKQPLTEKTTLDLMTIIETYIRFCVETDKGFDDESVVARSGTEMAAMLNRKRDLPRSTVLALYNCGIEVILQLHKEQEAGFTPEE